ncbi:MAG: LamB/YcsF family protein, partial [Gemmatimonadota bacterium]|nr:LamB/YcsF family protein [Gemmatimonadota bacterium]
ADVLPHITSANIACGFHGGDPSVMRKTVAGALVHGVTIGAHPGLPDLAGFGRRTMDVSPDDVYEMIVYQVGALMAFATVAGTKVRHVKPHGALYNMAAADPALAEAVAQAVRDVDQRLVLFALAGSHLIGAGEAAGLRTASETFADRGYNADGSLVSRKRPGALVSDADEAVRRAARMVRDGKVRSVDGSDVAVRADTICIHGDGPHAAEFARRLRSGLEAEGVDVRPVD